MVSCEVHPRRRKKSISEEIFDGWLLVEMVHGLGVVNLAVFSACVLAAASKKCHQHFEEKKCNPHTKYWLRYGFHSFLGTKLQVCVVEA